MCLGSLTTTVRMGARFGTRGAEWVGGAGGVDPRKWGPKTL